MLGRRLGQLQRNGQAVETGSSELVEALVVQAICKTLLSAAQWR